jgi:exo-beta-1,3-glucanase (GH17 family)
MGEELGTHYSFCSKLNPLLQFGFDGGNIWQKRRDTLFSTLHSNPKAKFVTRGVQFGSEPLFDSVLSHGELAQQVKAAKAALASLHIKVTVSDMAYGFQKSGGAQDVLDAVDFASPHMLPFFSSKASTGQCFPN